MYLATKYSTSTTTTGPSYTCKDKIALVPELVDNKNSSSLPRYFVNPLTPYKPTDINPGEKGVSFPTSTKAYIIIVPVAPGAIIKSIRLPKTTNVDQIRVMFLDAQDQPISSEPSSSVPLQLTSKLENSPKVIVNVPIRVNSVHINLIHTNDNQPPRDLTVEVMECVEPESATTTSKIIVTPPPSNYSISTPCKIVEIILFSYLILLFFSSTL